MPKARYFICDDPPKGVEGLRFNVITADDLPKVTKEYRDFLRHRCREVTREEYKMEEKAHAAMRAIK